MTHRLLGLAILFTILTSGGASRSALAQSPPARVPGHVLGALPHATKQGKAPNAAGQPLTLTVVLNREDQAGFDAFVNDVHNPGSANFQHFASQADLTSRFGPSQPAYDAVLAHLQQSGFTLVHGSANRLTLTVKGTRAQAEQAFGVSLDDYQLDGRGFYANDADPALPAAIAPYVQAITGLSNLAIPEPHVKTQPATAPAVSTAPAHTPMAIAQAYDLGGTGTNGAGQKIGLAEFDNAYFTDVSNWLNYVGLPQSLMNQLSEVNVNGGTPSSGGNGTVEVLLDIDTVMGMAQGAHYVVYDAPNCNPTCTSFQTIFNAMIADGDTVISNSWGDCENDTTLADVTSIDSILATAAASGISVYSASGDDGLDCDGVNVAVDVPADAPHGTGVGGTSLSVTPTGGYQSETFWANGAGVGGDGVSVFFGEPSYQTGWVSATGRSVPDVSADADPNSGVTICTASCPAFVVGGTSLSAPIWAAGTALINQKHGGLIGSLNQALYKYGTGSGFHSAGSMGSSFSQVGLGSFDLGNLATALSGSGGGTTTAPAVTAVSPASAPVSGGTAVTVNGSGFVAGTSGTSFAFGANTAAQVSCSSTSTCTVTSPSGQPGTVDVKAKTAAGTSATSSADQFTYRAASAPAVTGISPASGPSGGNTTVTISGSGFSTASNGTTVKFGTKAGSHVSCSSTTTCTAVSPSGTAGTVDVTATTAAGTSATSSADQFTYLGAPTVTAISPASGPTAGGTTVTISGTGFVAGTTGTSFKFGSTAGTQVSCSDANTCTVISPARSAGTVDIKATTAGGTSATGAADKFTYLALPAVTKISPTSGPSAGGTSVTVTGSNFVRGTTGTSFDFGAVAGTQVNCGSNTSCTVVSPAGSASTAVDVTATTAGGTSATSSADKFTYGP